MGHMENIPLVKAVESVTTKNAKGLLCVWQCFGNPTCLQPALLTCIDRNFAIRGRSVFTVNAACLKAVDFNAFRAKAGRDLKCQKRFCIK